MADDAIASVALCVVAEGPIVDASECVCLSRPGQRRPLR